MHILWKKCQERQPKKQHLTVCTSASVERSIKDLIKGKEDAELSARVGTIDVRAKKVEYLQKCKQEYVDSHQKKVRNKKRGIHDGIYDEFYRDIHLFVIRDNLPMMAKESYNIFCEMWTHHNEDRDDIPCYRTVINKLFTHLALLQQ